VAENNEGTDVQMYPTRLKNPASRGVRRLEGCACSSNHVRKVFTGTPIRVAIWRGVSPVSLAYLQKASMTLAAVIRNASRLRRWPESEYSVLTLRRDEQPTESHPHSWGTPYVFFGLFTRRGLISELYILIDQCRSAMPAAGDLVLCDLSVVGATRFERATSCSQSRRSTKLSYAPIFRKGANMNDQ
jgi:hypothetical protein